MRVFRARLQHHANLATESRHWNPLGAVGDEWICPFDQLLQGYPPKNNPSPAVGHYHPVGKNSQPTASFSVSGVLLTGQQSAKELTLALDNASYLPFASSTILPQPPTTSHNGRTVLFGRPPTSCYARGSDTHTKIRVEGYLCYGKARRNDIGCILLQPSGKSQYLLSNSTFIYSIEHA